MALNKGEWSELYLILFLLINPKLIIVDEKLIKIRSDLFKILDLNIFNSENNFSFKIISEKNQVEIYKNQTFLNSIEISYIKINKNILLEEIKKSNFKKGSFEIKVMNDLLQFMTEGKSIKSNSKSKSDLTANVFDFNMKKDINLKYSIKSSLGNSSTLLNASKNTDFRYKINNLALDNINIVNSINSNNKLLERIRKIIELGGIIEFDEVISPIFKHNLQMIDSNMPEILGDVLIRSYTQNCKNLKELFISSELFNDKTLCLKKLKDLLNGISFGFFPGLKWNGINEVNGGIMIVNNIGSVLVLDLVYHQNNVSEYLINNTKLDSPSSSRYEMLELKEKNGEVYFTLNLQIRYIK